MYDGGPVLLHGRYVRPSLTLIALRTTSGLPALPHFLWKTVFSHRNQINFSIS